MHTHQLAQITNPVIPLPIGSGGSEAGPPALGSIISGLMGIFFILSFVAAALYLILGGFNWITSGGDKAKLEAARNEITNALIGITIVGAGWAIMTLIGGFFGIQFPNFQIPTITGQ